MLITVMDKFGRYPCRLALILLAFSMMIFYITIVFSYHPSSLVSNFPIQSSCASHCLSYIQPNAAISSIDDIKKDDLEPTPPHYLWLLEPVSILLLYSAVVIVVFWLLSEQKRILLTTQLRI